MEYRILSRMAKQPCRFLDHHDFIVAVREDLAAERKRFGTSFVAVSVSYRGHVRTGHLRTEEEFLDWLCDSIEDLMDQSFFTAPSPPRETAPV